MQLAFFLSRPLASHERATSPNHTSWTFLHWWPNSFRANCLRRIVVTHPAINRLRTPNSVWQQIGRTSPYNLSRWPWKAQSAGHIQKWGQVVEYLRVISLCACRWTLAKMKRGHIGMPWSVHYVHGRCFSFGTLHNVGCRGHSEKGNNIPFQSTLLLRHLHISSRNWKHWVWECLLNQNNEQTKDLYKIMIPEPWYSQAPLSTFQYANLRDQTSLAHYWPLPTWWPYWCESCCHPPSCENHRHHFRSMSFHFLANASTIS